MRNSRLLILEGLRVFKVTKQHDYINAIQVPRGDEARVGTLLEIDRAG